MDPPKWGVGHSPAVRASTGFNTGYSPMAAPPRRPATASAWLGGTSGVAGVFVGWGGDALYNATASARLGGTSVRCVLGVAWGVGASQDRVCEEALACKHSSLCFAVLV